MSKHDPVGIHHTHQPGDRVRVARAHWHGIKFGAVCRVVCIFDDGDMKVYGPIQWAREPVQLGNQIVCGNTSRKAK